MDNIIYIITGILTAYPTLLYFLPTKYANYLKLGIQALEGIVTILNKLKDTKGGLSNERDSK